MQFESRRERIQKDNFENSGTIFREEVEDPVDYVREVPLAPWQIWEAHDFYSRDLRRGDFAAADGNLERAVTFYGYIEDSTRVAELSHEAMVRRLGTELKLGRSEHVLEEATNYVERKKIGPSELSTKLSLVIAYAYKHQKNYEQMFAWLNAAYKKVAIGSEVSNYLYDLIEDEIQQLPGAEFYKVSRNWQIDAFMGPLFKREFLKNGGSRRVAKGAGVNWYDRSTYLVYDVHPYIPKEEQESPFSFEDETETEPKRRTAQIRQKREVSVGVLLPLSGKYASYANKIKQGIELAHAKNVNAESIQIVYADTASNPVAAASSYEKFANDGISIVLGPLLVRTAESVAVRSKVIGVPFITFTKRGGIPKLGTSVFRLGATASSQTDDLVNYAAKNLGLKRFGIIHPANSGGVQFAKSFKDSLKKVNLEVVKEAKYQKGNIDSIVNALAQVKPYRVDALFLPDTLENLFPLLKSVVDSGLKGVQLLGPAQWDDLAAIRGYSQFLENAIYVSPFNVLSLDLAVSQFVSDYSERYSETPGLLEAQAYDAMNLALSVLPSVGYRQPEVIASQLKNIKNRKGITGSLSVSRGGEIKRKMSILQVKSGQVKELRGGR